MLQDMNILEQSEEALAQIRDYAKSDDAKRVQCVLKRPDGTIDGGDWGVTGPSIEVGVGPKVGLVVWSALYESYITIGGANVELVAYEADEWADVLYPAGVEHSIETVMDVVWEFIATGKRSDVVQWALYRYDTREMVFKGQAVNPVKAF